jgi:hypothetical protein
MFVIWWGTKVQRKDLGFVADFCRICREIRPFHLQQISTVAHVYDVAMGSAKSAGHSILCDVCGSELAVASEPLPVPAETPDDLHPGPWAEAARIHAKRIEVEQRRAAGTLTAGERHALLREPFELLEPWAESAARALSANRLVTLSSNMKSIVFLGSSMLLMAMGAGITWGIPNPKYDDSPHSGWLGVPLMIVGLVLLTRAAHLFYTATNRHVRTVVHPLLARALAPLVPTVEELSAIVSEHRGAGHAIGRYLSPKPLHQAIHSSQPHGAPSK